MHERFKQLRAALHITQQQLADAVKLSRNYIAMIETGQREPGERTISDVCRIFGVDEIWLRTGEGQPFRDPTKDEILAEVFAKAKIGDEPRDRMIRAFARLPVEDYAAMEKILLHIIEQVAQSHETPPEPPSAKKEETP